MNITVNTKYLHNEPATVYKGKYADGSIALMLQDDEYGERLCTATIRLDNPPAEGNVYIKDWSENEGILASLIEQGVISEPIMEVRTGFCFAYECTLIGDPLELT